MVEQQHLCPCCWTLGPRRPPDEEQTKRFVDGFLARVFLSAEQEVIESMAAHNVQPAEAQKPEHTDGRIAGGSMDE